MKRTPEQEAQLDLLITRCLEAGLIEQIGQDGDGKPIYRGTEQVRNDPFNLGNQP